MKDDFVTSLWAKGYSPEDLALIQRLREAQKAQGNMLPLQTVSKGQQFQRKSKVIDFLNDIVKQKKEKSSEVVADFLP